MSRLFVYAAAGGAILGGLALASRTRQAQNAGAIPVDDELNPRPYVVDPATAHRQHLDENAKHYAEHALHKAEHVLNKVGLRAGGVEPVGADASNGRITHTIVESKEQRRQIAASDGLMRQRELLFDEMVDAGSAKKLKSKYEYEHNLALQAQVRHFRVLRASRIALRREMTPLCQAPTDSEHHEDTVAPTAGKGASISS